MAQNSLPRARRLLLAFALAAVAASTAAIPAHAQEFPRWEAFGGFSYAHVDLGSQANLFGPLSKNYYGVHLGVNFNPYRNFSVVLLDLGVQSGGSRVPPAFQNSSNSVDTLQALFGPELKIRSRKANAFAHALVGINNTRLFGTNWFGAKDLVDTTNLALGFGGGLDVNWKRYFAIRVLQADYIPTRVQGQWQSDFRVSTGIVFRFAYAASR
jgi:opacity protein-like surface antigen